MSSNVGRRLVVLLALGQLIALPLFELDRLRVRTLFVGALAVVAYLAIRQMRALSAAERPRLALYLGLSAAVVVIPGLAVDGSIYGAARASIPLLLGWTVPLALLDREPEPSPRLPFLSAVPIPLWLALAAGLWLAVRPPGHHPVGLDEVLYLLQAQYVRHAPFMRPLAPELAPFFLIRQSYFLNGYLNGQYPPGWPLVLSLVQAPSLGWLLLLLVHLLLLAATYAFGRAAATPRVGLLAAGLVAVNGYVLKLSTLFLPHVAVATLALFAGTLMIGGLHTAPSRTALSWGLAGLLLGFACALRPLTGLTLAAALWLWLLLRERPPFGRAAMLTAAACAGGVLPIAWLLYYNLETTGSALRFGYALAQHGLSAMGFGMRGLVEYTSDGIPFERATWFGLPQALRNLGTNFHAALIDCWPTCLIFPLLYLASREGLKWRWAPLASFALLPLGYFFYFYNYLTDRFYFELIPFAMVGTALVLSGLAQRNRGTGLALGMLLFATLAADTAAMAIARGADYQPWTSSSAAVEEVRAAHPKLLVFVNAAIPATGEPGLAPVYWYNVYRFPSDVVVARDLGASDTLLARRFPGRYAIRLSILPGPPGGPLWLTEVRPLTLE